MKRLRYFILIIISSLVAGSASAQYREAIDSLYSHLLTVKESSERLSTIKALYNRMDVGTEKELQLELLHFYIDQANAADNIKEEAYARTRLMVCYFNFTDYQSYLDSLEETLDFMSRNECWSDYFFNWSAAIDIYYHTQRVKQGLDETRLMYDKAIELGNTVGLGMASYCMGKANLVQKEPEAALACYEEAINHIKGDDEQLSFLFRCYDVYCEALNNLQRFAEITPIVAKMEQTTHQMIKYREQQGLPPANMNDHWCQCYARYIRAYLGLGQSKVAEEYYLKSVFLFKLNKIERNHIQLNDLYAEILAAQNRYSEAIAVTDISLEYYTKIDNLLSIRSSTHWRAYFNYLAGNYKASANDFSTLLTLNDSISSRENSRQLQELQTIYDLDKLRLEKSQLRIRQQYTLLIAVGVLLLVMIGWSINIFRLLLRTRRLKREVEVYSERALEGERMKSAFIDSVCHEIRTPLNAINGFVNLVTDPSIEAESKVEFAQIIHTNTEHLTSLLSDMIEVADLCSTTDELSLEEIDAVAVCQNCIERIQSVSTKPNLELIFVNPGTATMIRTHMLYFERVVRNVLSNAYKFTDQGSITLSCNLFNDGRAIRVSIADTGVGIPADKREYIFERFTKLNAFTHGTGLGLYVCHLITKRLDGRIFVDPNYSPGTMFVLEFDNCVIGNKTDADAN